MEANRGEKVWEATHTHILCPHVTCGFAEAVAKPTSWREGVVCKKIRSNLQLQYLFIYASSVSRRRK